MTSEQTKLGRTKVSFPFHIFNQKKLIHDDVGHHKKAKRL
jgi:hypothetical protein